MIAASGRAPPTRPETHSSASARRFAYVTRRAGDRGPLPAGVIPPCFPVAFPRRRPARVESRWKTRDQLGSPAATPGVLEACANREIDVLYLVGGRFARDFPVGALALRALENVPVKIVQSLELGSLEPFADAFLRPRPSSRRKGT